MPEREAVAPERHFKRRTKDSGLNARRARAVVDFDHAIESRHVDADYAQVSVVDVRFHATAYARAAPVRDGRDPCVVTPIEERHDVGFIFWVGYEIRRMRKIAR